MSGELRELTRTLQNTTVLRRYEIYTRKPPEDELRLMWIIWAVLTGVIALFCFVVVAGILFSKATRKNSFNVFLVCLILPDAFFSFNCAITCALNYVAGEYLSHAMCEWQSWYVIFDFTANAWLNALIARQMRQIVVQSYHGRRFKSPDMKGTLLQIGGVYVYSGLVASLTLLEGILPIRASTAMGLACLPVEFSVASTIFFWTFCVPAIMGVPLVYTLWACYDVYKRGILPSRGRTRFLFIFFMRLAAVFVFMWIPTIVILFAIGTPNFWLIWSGGTWSHMQGFVSTAFILTKPDVHKATLSMLCCVQYVPTSRSSLRLLRSTLKSFTSLGSTSRKSHVVDKDSTASPEAGDVTEKDTNAVSGFDLEGNTKSTVLGELDDVAEEGDFTVSDNEEEEEEEGTRSIVFCTQEVGNILFEKESEERICTVRFSEC